MIKAEDSFFKSENKILKAENKIRIAEDNILKTDDISRKAGLHSAPGDLIGKARAGESVWVGDVREAFAQLSDCFPLTLRFTLLDSTVHEFFCPLPKWETPEERQFVLDYLCVTVYNTLSAIGGGVPEYIFDRENEPLAGLIADVQKKLMPDQPGYGRIIREVERIGRLAGTVDTDRGKDPDETLPEYLRRVTEDAMHGVRGGIDVGGTDIKCAVAVDGRLTATLEYDWNPGSFRFASELTEPVFQLAKELLEKADAERFDGLGLSFPDVVIGNRICGGETPKTDGIRAEKSVDYEQQFAVISGLSTRLEELCKPGVTVRTLNDGFVAAFSSAVELAYSDTPELLEKGVLSHALGTSLGSGWLNSDGTFPKIPLEFYDSVIDLGSVPKGQMDAADLRSTRSSSGVQGTDRYAGQASAFRFAYEAEPSLLDGYTEEMNGILRMKTGPEDLRKPCLEHLMREAGNGSLAAQKVFYQIGEAFGRISRELIYDLHPETDVRYVFGRFVKYQAVFEQICRGFTSQLPEIRLVAADENMAFSPLMKELAARPDVTVAQFGQAVGAVILSAK